MKNIRLIIGASIGTMLEFYDFVIFIVLTPIIAPLFFPASDPQVSLLSGYATFAMSFLMRPLGGYFFGALGDRYGRFFSLNWSMCLMGVATFLMACLPTYQHIGFLAPLLLIFCRLLQGFSAGGEYSGAAVVVLEKAASSSFFRASSFIPMAAVLAVISGSQITRIWALDPQSIWGWRIPFFIGSLVAFVGFFLRKSFGVPALKKEVTEKVSLWTQKNWNPLITMTFLSGLGVMIYYTFASYIVSFLTFQAGWSKSDAYLVSISASLGAFILMYPVSWLADKVLDPWKIISWVCLSLSISAIPLFYLLSLGEATLVFALIPVISIFWAAFVLTNGLTARLFPVEVRFRAMAFSYTVGASLFGGTAPMIYTYLVQETGISSIPGCYLAVIALLNFLILRLNKR